MAQQDTQAAGSGQTISTDRRLGRIRIDDQLLRNSFDTGMLAELFRGSFVLDIDRDWISQVSTYTLWHEALPPIAEGAITPAYAVRITRDKTGQTSVEFHQEHCGVLGLFDVTDLMEGGAA